MNATPLCCSVGCPKIVEKILLKLSFLSKWVLKILVRKESMDGKK